MKQYLGASRRPRGVLAANWANFPIQNSLLDFYFRTLTIQNPNFMCNKPLFPWINPVGPDPVSGCRHRSHIIRRLTALMPGTPLDGAHTRNCLPNAILSLLLASYFFLKWTSSNLSKRKESNIINEYIDRIFDQTVG